MYKILEDLDLFKNFPIPSAEFIADYHELLTGSVGGGT